MGGGLQDRAREQTPRTSCPSSSRRAKLWVLARTMSSMPTTRTRWGSGVVASNSCAIRMTSGLMTAVGLSRVRSMSNRSSRNVPFRTFLKPTRWLRSRLSKRSLSSLWAATSRNTSPSRSNPVTLGSGRVDQNSCARRGPPPPSPSVGTSKTRMDSSSPSWLRNRRSEAALQPAGAGTSHAATPPERHRDGLADDGRESPSGRVQSPGTAGGIRSAGRWSA